MVENMEVIEDSTVIKDTPNLEKAAVLLLTLENASPGIMTTIVSKLGESRAKIVLEKIANIGKISSDKRQEAISDFYGIALDKQFVFGGMDVSSKILKESFGINKAKEFFKHKKEKFSFFEDVETNELKEFLMRETDQMKLFIFNFLSPKKASELLNLLDDDNFAMKIINTINIPNMDLLYDFEIELATYFNAVSEDGGLQGSGEYLQKLASTIEYLPSTKRDHLLSRYSEANPEFSEKLKALIFTFEDFITISDQIFQTILFDISDFRLIAMAQVHTAPELVEKIQICLTERTKAIVDSESMGLEKKVTAQQVEEAKRKIVAVARKMESKGEIKLERDLAKAPKQKTIVTRKKG